MRAHLGFPVAVLLGACGGGGDNPGGGVDASGGADAKVWMDAAPVVPAMITVSGNTSERGLGGTSSVSNVAIAVYASANPGTALATTTSDAQGDFSLMVPTNAMPVHGYVKATKANYLPIYTFGTGPMIANFADADVNMLTPSNKDFLLSLAGATQDDDKGMIGLQVRDGDGNPVEGATISSTPPSTYRYTGANELPSSSATMTSADGVAFMFNAPVGDITVTATKNGIMFNAHVVQAFGDGFTNTSITP